MNIMIEIVEHFGDTFSHFLLTEFNKLFAHVIECVIDIRDNAVVISAIPRIDGQDFADALRPDALRRLFIDRIVSKIERCLIIMKGNRADIRLLNDAAFTAEITAHPQDEQEDHREDGSQDNHGIIETPGQKSGTFLSP